MSAFVKRMALIGGFFTLGLILMFYQLFRIQVIHGDWMAETVLANSTEAINGEQYPRGSITDRYGRSLTDEGERPALLIIPSLIQDRENTAKHLEKILSMDREKTMAAITASLNSFLAVNLNPEQVSRLAGLGLPGLEVMPYQTRYGPGSLAEHLVGHLGKAPVVSAAEMLPAGQFQGTKGIEAIYDELLRGNRPNMIWKATRDATGKVLAGNGFNKVEQKDPSRGEVRLTVDRDIQKIVEDVLDRMVPIGTAVVLEVQSGEILAMASRPGYDQNNLQNFQETAFNNRALQYYYPGSVFKVAVAAVALEEGFVTVDEKFVCTGSYTLSSGLTFPCWLEEGHGELTFLEALAVSCNPAFIEVGQRMGRERLLTFAKKSGLTKNILLGYPQADPEFPVVNIDPYGPGPLANASLGQEGIKLTPIQVAALLATVADKGIYHVPSVVKEVRSGDGRIVEQFGKQSGIRVMSAATAETLQQMLLGVTLFGTGQEAWLPRWGSAGKTSTAESGMRDGLGRDINYSWFAGYAPLNSPQYVTVVMVEGGSSGGSSAAPVFREIMERISDR